MEDSLLDSFYDEEIHALENAKREFKKAVASGEHNAGNLEIIMMPVLEMLDSENESMALYLEYIDYLNSFDNDAAYEAVVAMDNICGFKNHVVIAAAYVLEKVLCEDLSIETINLVSSLNKWKEKVVGMLYSSSPWPDSCTKEELLKRVVEKSSSIKDSVNYDTRMERYCSMLDVYPSENVHDPLDRDIEMISEALDMLFYYKDKSTEQRIEALKSNKLAWSVRFQEISALEQIEKGSELEKEYNAWMQL